MITLIYWVLRVFTYEGAFISAEGALLAVLSDAIASALGYFVWYIALTGLTVTRAAVVQLFVPLIAASGGVLFTNEQITLRLVVASVLVLGSTLLVILGKGRVVVTDDS